MGDSLSHLDDLLILDSNSVHNYLTVVFLRRKKTASFKSLLFLIFYLK